MARTTSPLWSLDASGTVAGALVFSKWKGRSYVRRHSIPSNPRTPLQLSVRAIVSWLAREWKGAPDNTKSSWEALAKVANVSPFNAQVSYDAIRWRRDEGPSQSYPADPVSTPADPPTSTPSGGHHYAQLSIMQGTAAPSWAWIVHRSDTTGFTPSVLNAVAIIDNSQQPKVFSDAPLAPGVYYYRVRGLNSDGTLGTFEPEVQATVT